MCRQFQRVRRLIFIRKILTFIRQIKFEHHLSLCAGRNGATIIWMMAEVQTKSLHEEIRWLKEPSIPHLNMMESQVCMSGNTTGVTPEVRAKAIPTPICARGLLAI